MTRQTQSLTLSREDLRDDLGHPMGKREDQKAPKVEPKTAHQTAYNRQCDNIMLDLKRPVDPPRPPTPPSRSHMIGPLHSVITSTCRPADHLARSLSILNPVHALAECRESMYRMYQL